MRIAVITDIHGNLTALEAALAALESIGVDGIYCGGDLVGYGPHPNEVCALIQDRGIPTIYGNYDYAIARDLTDCGCAYVTPHDRELGQKSIDWTLAHTNARSKAFMSELPFDLRFAIGNQQIRLVHGSPARSTSICSRTSPSRSTTGSPGRPSVTCWCSGTRISRGSTHTAACSSSTAARWASPRMGTLGPPLRSSNSSMAASSRRLSVSRTTRRRSPGTWRRSAYPRSSQPSLSRRPRR